ARRKGTGNPEREWGYKRPKGKTWGCQFQGSPSQTSFPLPKRDTHSSPLPKQPNEHHGGSDPRLFGVHPVGGGGGGGGLGHSGGCRQPRPRPRRGAKWGGLARPPQLRTKAAPGRLRPPVPASLASASFLPAASERPSKSPVPQPWPPPRPPPPPPAFYAPLSHRPDPKPHIRAPDPSPEPWPSAGLPPGPRRAPAAPVPPPHPPHLLRPARAPAWDRPLPSGGQEEVSSRGAGEQAPL
ncbi:extensin-like, partial [Vombatus ursinus]|uniref:extensin-like n=1 Tax=Vombatus ursinus TaxID=29139 RepID=UPI000FFD1252